jgi:DNA polymerase V
VRVARRLREQRSVASAVHVFIRTSPHRAQDRQHAPCATMPLPRPTADTRGLVVAAIQALRSIYKPGYRYAKAGVMLLELQDDRQEQQATLDLFDKPEQKQPDGRRDLMETIDALNERFGRDAVSIASAAKSSTHSAHASRQDRRSPRYTTRLDEVVTVRA